MTTRKSTTPYGRERRLFFMALSLLLILCAGYIYFLSSSVVHVIARKEIDQEIAQLHSRIGDLESAYIAAQRSITSETIDAHGFIAAAGRTTYVEEMPTTLVLVHANDTE